MPELVTVQGRGPACVVTPRRPRKLNAISATAERELCDALAGDEPQRAACGVITGGQDVFSAGADIHEMRGQDPAAIVEHDRARGDFAERVADLPPLTLSGISGWCLGGGLELALMAEDADRAMAARLSR